jgi:hypothetical protein
MSFVARWYIPGGRRRIQVITLGDFPEVRSHGQAYGQLRAENAPALSLRICGGLT